MNDLFYNWIIPITVGLAVGMLLIYLFLKNKGFKVF